MFWWDVLVDCYFITDVVLNFRLAYYDEASGRLETDRNKIRDHYLKGWFGVDFLASIPFTWFFTAYETSGETNQARLRMIKTVRMLRLLKMLRVTRIMKLLDRHAKYTDWTVAMSSCLTMLTIMYGVHLLSCFWYMAGSTNNLGWVHRLLSQPTPQCPICPDIHITNRYVHAMYTVPTPSNIDAIQILRVAPVLGRFMTELLPGVGASDGRHDSCVRS